MIISLWLIAANDKDKAQNWTIIDNGLLKSAT
jgi:hypothetical protein